MDEPKGLYNADCHFIGIAEYNQNSQVELLLSQLCSRLIYGLPSIANERYPVRLTAMTMSITKGTFRKARKGVFFELKGKWLR